MLIHPCGAAAPCEGGPRRTTHSSALTGMKSVMNVCVLILSYSCLWVAKLGWAAATAAQKEDRVQFNRAALSRFFKVTLAPMGD